jgi:hypothetical protein
MRQKLSSFLLSLLLGEPPGGALWSIKYNTDVTIDVLLRGPRANVGIRGYPLSPRMPWALLGRVARYAYEMAA